MLHMNKTKQNLNLHVIKGHSFRKITQISQETKLDLYFF
jgi:hypothetical protein